MVDLSSCLSSTGAFEACATAYITQPGWRATLVVIAGFLCLAQAVGNTFTHVLDFLYLPAACRLGWAHRTTSRRMQLRYAHIVFTNGVNIISTLILPITTGVVIMSHMGVTLQFQWLRWFWVTALNMLLFDTWYYWTHRIVHKQKWLYRNVHADHHQHIAMMEARTSLVFSIVEGLFLLGIPNSLGILVYVWWYQSPDILNVAPSMLVSSLLAITAHTGVEFHGVVPFLAANPFIVTALVPGTCQRPYDHQVSHQPAGCQLNTELVPDLMKQLLVVRQLRRLHVCWHVPVTSTMHDLSGLLNLSF
jgi:sterol desaturase/sphingolipid hydroxylase (fatty acid hydroxylase superfamily)